MSKHAITQLFVGAALAFVVGLVIGLVAIVVAIADGVITFGGPDNVNLNGEALGGMLIWLVTAGLVISAATLAAVVSWIGALLNTLQLEDKTWFIVLLVLGLASFGWLAMIAYIFAGPDRYAKGKPSAEIPSAARP